MGDDPAAAQLLEEVLSTVERFHFDIDAADLGEGMSVGTRAGWNSQAASEVLRPAVYLRLRAAIEDLYDIDLVGDPLDSLLAHVAPARVIRVFKVDEPTLGLDRHGGFLGRQLLRDDLLEEETDQFAFAGEDLLADNHLLAGIHERPRPVDRVVVGQNDRGEAELPATAGYFDRGNPAVERGRAVQVEVYPDQRGPCASGHVGYYRRTEEGSGMISGAAVGW